MNALLTAVYLQEDGDESDDDDEIEIGGVTQDYKCMLTLQTLEEPLRSCAKLPLICHS